MSASNIIATRSSWQLALLTVLLAGACGGDDPDTSPASVADAAVGPSSDVAVNRGDGPADATPRSDGATPDAMVPGAECAKKACSGAVADLCCPSACTAATDIDCGGCGNGRMEPGETCDPLQSCPIACPSLNCQKQRLKSEGTCSAACVSAGEETECKSGDGCCPSGCTGGNDRDCGATCGNGALESGETCDPLASCPESCPALGCTVRKLEGTGTCGARCVAAGDQTACVSGDGCCPSTCNRANDDDCAVTCGNGVREGKETCDPLGSCPTEATCKSEACKIKKLLNAGTCTAVCADEGVQTVCQNGDGCCPAGCHRNNDNDCTALCGNGQLEAGETCDPAGSCLDKQKACVSDGDVVRTPEGSAAACTFQCREAPRACGPKDGGCPAGCTAGQDADCPGCGNGIKEANETCDPCSQAEVAACVSEGSIVRTPSGDPAACTFVCTSAPKMCGGGDDLCPLGCTPAQDPDCRYPAGAICTMDLECQSNRCIDGRCCAQTCGNCQSCTGPGGTCTNIVAGQEDQVPAQACSGGATCNGSGACVLPNGSVCTVNAQCGSGVCKDKVCCNQACTGPCRTCAAPGLAGTCSVVVSAEDPDTCSAEMSTSCDANGACVSIRCALVPSPSQHDFGSVFLGGVSANGVVTFRNHCTSAVGPLVVSLSGADAAEFGIVTNGCTGTLAAGATCTVTIRMAPGSAGPKAATLSVQSTAASASVSLSGVATAGAKLGFKPGSVTFGTVNVGQSRDEKLTIVNEGTGPTGAMSVGINALTRAQHFTIVQNGCTSLPAGGDCLVVLRFAPRSSGNLSTTLSVSSPGGSGTAGLSGTGTQPPLLLSPSSHSYGVVFVGRRATATFTATNTSGMTLSGPRFGVDGAISLAAAPPDFYVSSHDCPEAWRPDVMCTATVLFGPRTAGGKGNTLHLSANLPTGAPVSAASTLTGTGVDDFVIRPPLVAPPPTTVAP